MSPKGVSPTGAASVGFTSIFSGNAASVKPTHLRTPSYESISRKVDRVLEQVYRGDEQIVRVSLAVMSERGDSHAGSAHHSRSGSGDSSGRWSSVAWFSGNRSTNKGDGADAGSQDDSDGGGGSPKGSHVRVTLFVENPAPGRRGPPRVPTHQRKPSEVGLEEMAEAIHHEIHAPLEALDATAAPPALTPTRPRSADASNPAPLEPGSPTTPQIPSPWKRSAGGLGEKWCDKVERVRSSSPYGTLPGWSLKPVIIKAGDNCRQELLAIQLTQQFRQIYRNSGLPLWIRPFEVIAQSTTSAFIEAVTDAPSIHAIKSRAPRGTSLRQHFEARFGAPGQPRFRQAQRNFVESLAGYSILTYILQVKDRHNGNILLHDDGPLIHIDFNFMLSTSPGGINFESSPFKLTREYLEVMDSDDTGAASEAFNYYKVLCIQGYLSVRKHAERIVQLVEMMSASGCPCFKAGPKVLQNLRRRFNLECTEEQCVEIMLGLISDSMDAWCTRQYDFYQRVLNGIL